jgi:hypothetical protein
MESAELYPFLSRFRYGVVSSLSPSKGPQSALVGIAVTAKLEIVFETGISSRKYANMLSDPRCSLVVGWDGEQTVQLEGLASEPMGAELIDYQEVYFATWPECRAHLAWPDIVYFVVRPVWIRYSDFDRRPPLIREWSFSIGGTL